MCFIFLHWFSTGAADAVDSVHSECVFYLAFIYRDTKQKTENINATAFFFAKTRVS